VDNPAPQQPIEPAQPLPVLLGVPAGPQPQNRMTVAFRLLLAIPHYIVLFALGIGAVVITIIGWFAALFTGRLPAFAYRYLSGVLHWSTRVHGYILLLTDAYPPFTMDDVEYPVRVAIPPPGPLNRLAVLFRFFIGLLAMIVVTVLGYGAMSIIAFIAWVCTLVLGRLPAPLHGAFAAVVRYQARFDGYWCMLTPEYPWGLFGDRDPEATWALRPTSGAKGWLAAILVVGVASYGGVVAVDASNAVSNADTISSIDNDFNGVADAVNGAQTTMAQCQSLSCATGEAGKAEQALQQFSSQVSGLSTPTSAASQAASGLVTAADTQARLYGAASRASTEAELTAIMNSSALSTSTDQLNSQYKALRDDLQNNI
jgi:hypothetical protein